MKTNDINVHFFYLVEKNEKGHYVSCGKEKHYITVKHYIDSADRITCGEYLCNIRFYKNNMFVNFVSFDLLKLIKEKPIIEKLGDWLRSQKKHNKKPFDHQTYPAYYFGEA